MNLHGWPAHIEIIRSFGLYKYGIYLILSSCSCFIYFLFELLYIHNQHFVIIVYQT